MCHSICRWTAQAKQKTVQYMLAWQAPQMMQTKYNSKSSVDAKQAFVTQTLQISQLHHTSTSKGGAKSRKRSAQASPTKPKKRYVAEAPQITPVNCTSSASVASLASSATLDARPRDPQSVMSFYSPSQSPSLMQGGIFSHPDSPALEAARQYEQLMDSHSLHEFMIRYNYGSVTIGLFVLRQDPSSTW